MVATFLTAIVSFASTNIDNIFILMILYAQTYNRSGIVQIIIGQYLGIGCLTVLSILGALGTQIIPSKYIGLLGFLPLILGVRAWISYRNQRHGSEGGEQKNTQTSLISVALLTMANGADNIGVYIPVFSGYSLVDFAVTAFVFAIMIALWCYLGYILIRYPYVKRKITKYQHILVPIVLISLGFAIIIKSYIL
ncbi:MAG TPA: cadmium resistance transporter [Candidatus Faecousia intestinigallinarum]|nr:cadmium resistance transporter [Candidatus Faecousia intestinigallinarum]